MQIKDYADSSGLKCHPRLFILSTSVSAERMDASINLRAFLAIKNGGRTMTHGDCIT